MMLVRDERGSLARLYKMVATVVKRSCTMQKITGDRTTDVLTPEQRSRCMSNIKGKNTKPELVLRKILWGMGIRYRLHYNVTGKPDLAFPGGKLVVFIDGCFWHKCPIHYQAPKTRAKFWEKKISGNVARDAIVTEKLESEGWRVLRFWEHELKNNLDNVVSRIVSLL